MNYKHLLAKSCPDPENPPEAATLEGHTAQVVEAAKILNEYIEEHVLDYLSHAVSNQEWRDILICAAWLHDLGKANDHFQEALLMKGIHQGIRHETIGIVIIENLLGSWLANFWQRHPPWIKAAVLFSVAGHHLKFPDPKTRTGIAKLDVTFLGDHPQTKQTLNVGVASLSLPPPPQLFRKKYSLRPFDENSYSELLDQIIRNNNKTKLSQEQKKVVAALKNMLMCADLAGSALPEKGLPMNAWISQRLRGVFLGNELKGIVKKKLGKHKPRSFQQKVSDSSAKTVLLVAGCGAGKTVAAYQWASKAAQGKRLFFCYPTTATASEGFSSYLSEPDFEALLVHSRMKVDYRLLENMPHRSQSQKELSYLGLEALDTWPSKAIVCTAHTVLGILQNTRRGIYAWPSLARGVFIFDEIHAFSDQLFAHLLRFLELFQNAYVLLMTATLPPLRKKALEEICERRGNIEEVCGPPKREAAPRYILAKATEKNAWQQCCSALSQGLKVLWVCNTVDRAINITLEALEFGLPVQPYHSRYRYRDRLIRQRTVIDGFQPDKPAMLAVTTQVAEMSLDLSANMLITEYAPVPNLIQRLGRLNRFDEMPTVAESALFIRPENAAPYTQKKDEDAYWSKIESWLEYIADSRPKSQQDLFAAFIAVEDGSYEKLELPHSDWVDQPWRSETDRHSLMEPGYTIEMVREEDVGSGVLAEMAIPMPMPRGKNWAWKTKGRYVIAPQGAIEYDPFWGGKYAKPDEFEII